ncbi:MAG: hypothetical protein RMK29_00640 [Myxococcales bacterium]|nr:hypothetical protein [Myxococcota bacterium]MDW8280184.1 hypothetical protein [Myxococcales bacterium]
MWVALALVGVLAVLPDPVLVGTPEALEVATDDPQLGQAIVRSAAQQFLGGVRLIPPGAARTPGRALRLRVQRVGPARLWLVLSQGPALRVQRSLAVGVRADPFDVAESVALALLELRARLQELRLRAQAGGGRRQPLAPVPPEPPPEPRPDPSPQPPPVPREPTLAGEGLSPPALPPEPPRPWRAAVGACLGAAGLGLLALGAVSLAVDGTCVDSVCERRYAGRTAGSVELAVGTAAAVAGGVLIGAEVHLRRRGSLRHIALPVPLGIPAGAGLALVGTFF